MSDKPLFFIDTNIFLYYYSDQDDAKKRKAEKLLNDCWNRKSMLVLSNQILAEFTSAALAKMKISSQMVSSVVDDIAHFTGFIKLNYSEHTVIAALDVMAKQKLPFWDALIIATMKENNLVHIYTENTKDFSVEGIIPINPFTL